MQATILIVEWAMNQNEQIETSAHLQKSLMNEEF
jgi:hypothetical protein